MNYYLIIRRNMNISVKMLVHKLGTFQVSKLLSPYTHLSLPLSLTLFTSLSLSIRLYLCYNLLMFLGRKYLPHAKNFIFIGSSVLKYPHDPMKIKILFLSLSIFISIPLFVPHFLSLSPYISL